MCDRAVVLVGVQNSAVRIWVAELQQSELVQLIMVVRILGTDLHADHSCLRVVSGSLAATGGTVVRLLIFSSSGASICGALCHCSWTCIEVGCGCAHDSNVSSASVKVDFYRWARGCFCDLSSG